MDSKEPKEKLATLEKVLPGKPRIVYEFARLFGQELQSRINSRGIAIALSQTLRDMQANQHDQIIIEAYFRLIVLAVFPEDFAAEVMSTRRQYMEGLRVMPGRYSRRIRVR